MSDQVTSTSDKDTSENPLTPEQFMRIYLSNSETNNQDFRAIARAVLQKLAEDSDIDELNFFKCDILDSLPPELVNKYKVYQFRIEIIHSKKS